MNWAASDAIIRAVKCTAIILSGGRGTRAGGADKGLLPWGASTRVESVITVIRPQVDTILLSCNRNLPRYKSLGYPVVTDELPDYQGPLAGISSCLRHCSTDCALVLPCDSPDPAPDLAERLTSALQQDATDVAYAHDGERAQFLFCALRAQCVDSLCSYLADGGRSVRGWLETVQARQVDFSDRREHFRNHNR